MDTQNNSVRVELLADNAHLITAVGELRWREWGRPPEPTDCNWWVEVTAHEAGRDRLPVTWIAINAGGAAVGAVGLGKFDIEERHDRSPWVLGMVVRPDFRGQRVGRLLLSHLEEWANGNGYEQVWVANEGPAFNFYQKCGWQYIETVTRFSGETIFVLTKRF